MSHGPVEVVSDDAIGRVQKRLFVRVSGRDQERKKEKEKERKRKKEREREREREEIEFVYEIELIPISFLSTYTPVDYDYV